MHIIVFVFLNAHLWQLNLYTGSAEGQLDSSCKASRKLKDSLSLKCVDFKFVTNKLFKVKFVSFAARVVILSILQLYNALC